METNVLGVQPTLPIGGENNGMQGGWFWIILLFLFFGFGGNGFGNNGMESEFIKRDLFNMQQSQANCCCEIQKGILESRYTTELGFQGLNQTIHAEGEATRALINANAMQDLRDRLEERDRELMSANLALQNNAQTRTIIDTLQPCPKPAYLTCSPYFSYGYNPCGGCGNL